MYAQTEHRRYRTKLARRFGQLPPTLTPEQEAELERRVGLARQIAAAMPCDFESAMDKVREMEL